MLVFLVVYHKSTFGKTLMYMQHRHMECVEYHICHEQVLDKNVNGNTYSAPLLHAALDVDHKVVIMVIGLYHNTFYIFVCNISIILNMILSVCPSSFTCYFSVFYIINYSMFLMFFRQVFLELSSQTDIIVLCARMH